MSSPAPPHRNVVPSEVGWQFVPQYYTFVNKQPDRLHCFYTKKSTFIHGTEGDDDNKPYHGQQEIHAKITSLGFEDCKVYIHSVDAQSSADGGIIIQVIGEMSNKGETWRKFVQTFFLAEQPNGYFVLNDIFRFLREETPEDETPADDQVLPESESEPQPIPSQPEPEPISEPAAPEPEPVREPTPVPTPPPPAPVVEPTPSAPEPVDEPAPISAAEPAPVAAAAPVAPVTNGINGHASPAPSAEPKPVSAPVQQPQAAPSGPPAKPTPKTWASLAASNTRSWGSAVAKEVRATTEAPPAPPAAKPTAAPAPPPAAARSGTASPAPTPAHSNTPLAAAQAVNTSACFVKGVTDPISNAALTQQLTTRFGPVKEVDVVRSKACAFIEFISVESAKKAIIASLPSPAGGEGGVWVDGDSTKMRLTFETRKERGERPVSRPRGGGPPGRGAPPTGGSVRGRGGAGRGGAKP